MKLIDPKVELLSELNITPESHIARCARVCYGKEQKEPNQEADRKMVEGLIKGGHLSMLRHASRYGKVPYMEAGWWTESPYCAHLMGYVSTNEQYILDNMNRFVVEMSPAEMLHDCKQNPLLFRLFRLTFSITTQISTSRELNRVSPNNIAERSTRFCTSKDGLEICKPWWWNEDWKDVRDPVIYHRAYYSQKAWEMDELYYKELIENGMKPEDARGVLPLDTATKVIYTYSIQEWRHIIDLRYYGTTGTPHPNAKLVIGMVREQINEFAKAHNVNYEI